jgi:23S rRNA (cytosine1962-C5)-methyltransferase
LPRAVEPVPGAPLNKTRHINHVRLHITPAAETNLRAGHPWLFATSIVEQKGQGELGALAAVYGKNDRVLGLGLFDPHSPIRVRMVYLGKAEPLTEDWWKRHLESAIERRTNLFDQQTTGFRWIHGENDKWPGLVLDRYSSTLVLKLYTSAWLPRIEFLVRLFVERFSPDNLVLRLSNNINKISENEFHKANGNFLFGPPPGKSVVFVESGLRFEANVIQGQKTGFFLDQRENRRRIEALAGNRDVLNVFSFSGAFSVYAARGGARSVADLDISKHALASAKRNFELNTSNPAVRACQQHLIQADAFEWLKQNSRKKYDLIILDPPSLAKRQSERQAALRAYHKLSASAANMLHPGGILVACSCSAHVPADDFFRVVRQAAFSANASFTEIQTTGHPADHPATFKEAHYLKSIFLSLKR